MNILLHTLLLHYFKICTIVIDRVVQTYYRGVLEMTREVTDGSKSTGFDAAKKEQKQIFGDDVPYEHHCHGKYEGVVCLHPGPHEVCPTCKDPLGKNGCDLQKMDQG